MTRLLGLSKGGASIKIIIKIIATVLVFFLLTSCTGKTNEFTETSEIKASEDDIDYFLPVEEYSSERTEAITHVVIHFMSAVVSHPDDPYNINYIRSIFIENNISTHYLIDRKGLVYVCIPEARNAWHAGKGTWKEFTDNMNSRSIGIELLGIGTYDEMKDYITKTDYKKIDSDSIGFTQAQYDSLNNLLNDIFVRNPKIIPDRNHVIGHCEYSPQRSDPGTLFDWSKLTFAAD